MFFENRANGYIEKLSLPGLWSFLFGLIYFASNGLWTRAAASLRLAFATAGLSWLVYPFFATQIMQTHFLRKGWIPLSRADVKEVREHTRKRAFHSDVTGRMGAPLTEKEWDQLFRLHAALK